MADIIVSLRSTPSCDRCRELESQQCLKGNILYLTDRLEKCKEEFFKAMNALINGVGGHVIVHANNVRFLGTFDQQVDKKLKELLHDSSYFHENFSRKLIIDQHHVLFKVKVRSGNRGLSTLKFNTTESLNAGRGDPTQRQMQRWIENIISEPSSDDEDDTDSDNGVDCPVFERDVEVTSSGMPFLENLCIQAKDINFGPKNKGKTDALRKGYDQGRIEKLTKHFWDVFGLPEYITAFSKIATGGSVYFGVEEDTKHREFKCNGFRLTENDRREMKRSIERKVCDTMLWVGLSPPKNPVIVKFPTVITREADWYVVEVKVNYYHGIAFHKERGPDAYTCNRGQVEQIEVPKWISKYGGCVNLCKQMPQFM
ncbi:hypothetical protein BaRGS_00026076 [Batillaria attramentaria]|uniref:Schlafen AlbA-2 domain-containing protein n=1 Tax=Batillaria attramentaria TaxID=370345 RepID=A0ABD0K6E0_9CAEN